MTIGIVVAVLLVLATAVAGSGLAVLADPDSPPFATGAVLALAAVVVFTTNVSVWWQFDARVPLVAFAALVVVPWMTNARVRGYPLRGRFARPANTLLVAALALAMPMLLLPVPLDTDAQGFGQLALAIRDGHSLDTLAPWRPGIAYLYAPGGLELGALMSALVPGADTAAAMMGVGHAAAFLFIWLAGDFGMQLALGTDASNLVEQGATRASTWSRLARVCALFSVGLWTALLDSHFTTIVALVFLLGFATTLLRAARTGRAVDLVATAILLAAIPITHADTAIIAALLGIAVVVAGLVDRGLAGPRALLRCALAAGVIALIVATPWLVSLRALVGAGVATPFHVAAAHWRVMLLFNGVVWPLLAFPGAVVARRMRLPWVLPMAIWMVLLVEFSITGVLEHVAPAVMGPIVRFNYPFSLAWHGPIVPCLALAIPAIAATCARTLDPPNRVTALVAAMMAACVLWPQPLVAVSRRVVHAYGAFATTNDVETMRWVRDHVQPAARILNYPGDYDRGMDWEAHWAPVITERDCVYFRMQPFFAPRVVPGGRVDDQLAAAYREQRELIAFWRDPADPSNLARLKDAAIDYVLVPDSVGNPGVHTTGWRWQPPATVPGARSIPADAPYLHLVHASGGAQVFAVVDRAS